MNPLRLLPFFLFFATLSLRAQEISPYLFGQNHWLAHGDENRTGYLHLLWPKVKEAGVKLVRVGGNAYNIQPPSLERWSAMVESIQSIDAEPLVQIPYTFSDEQVRALVSHFNAPGKRPVHFWSIGNEPMLHDGMPLEAVHAYLLRIATALRAAAPSAKILISDEAWLRAPAYEALCGGNLDLTGKDSQGRWLIDGFSFHSYPNGEKFTRHDVVEGSIQKIRADAKALVSLLEKANAKHQRTDASRLCWALTEVNVTYANPDRDIEGSGNTAFLAGQFLAEVFGIGMEYGAFTVAPWCISETDNVKTDFGFLGLPPDFAPRSSYYHTQLMAEFLRGHFVKSESADPLLKIVSARWEKQIAVLLLNENLKEVKNLTLNLSGDSSPLRVFAGVNSTLEVTLAGQTSQLLVFGTTGKLEQRITYGLAQNLRFLPPVREKF